MGALAGALLAAGCGERTVVVRDDGGRVLVEARLPESGRFALEYRHSYYRVPARERFEARGDGFRMVGVESPSEAVHPEAKNLDPKTGAEVIAPIELHPGAKRYYDESGGS